MSTVHLFLEEFVNSNYELPTICQLKLCTDHLSTQTMNYRPEIRDLDDDDLRTIAQEFGIDVAMRMRKIFGGRRIYIAKCPSKAEIRSFIGKHPRLVRSEILNALGISETTYYNAISGMMDFSERNTEESSHDKP